MDDNITQTPEQIADRLQYLGLLPGPQKPFIAYLTANTGLATSLGDLIDKIDDGTVTQNDYIDVLKDIGATVTGVVLLAELVGVTLLSAPAILGIGLGLAVLDYADEHNYDASEIYEDLQSKMSMLENYMNGEEQDGDPTADTDGDGIPDYLDPFPDKPAIPEGTVSIKVSNAVANEGDTAGQSAQVKVSLSYALSQNIHISLSNGGYVEIPAGSTSADATITWNGDTIPEENETIPVEILGFSYGGAENVVFGHDGSLSIVDDDKTNNGHPMDPVPLEPRRDPLVLDMDKDGFIGTYSLAESTAYFDLTGDGIQEKVGWIKANDGLVAYDKNENGKIDGIDEVFGNPTTTGFEELREVADSNYDGVIDRRDELYSRLKVWQDKNADGISQADELVSLSDAGVTSISLDVVGTNINLNGNLLTEASKYTDSDGNLELAADVELAFDSRITKIDTSTIPDYKEYPDSNTLPNLRGYGIVSDSYITYNIDENFRTLALEFGSDVTKVANEFESFMDGWSGYTKMQTDLQTKYNLNDTPKLSDLDRKVWTYEHFMGTGSFSAGIEQRLETTAKAMQSGGSDTAPAGRYNDAVVNRVYDSFTDRNRAFFSLKAFYPDVLSDALYEYGIDEYVITDQEALSAKVSAYINNPDNTLQEKLYLVSQMNTLQGTFLDFNAESITSNIDDTLVKNLVTSIYNDTLNAHVYDNGGIYSNNALIVGNDTDEVIDIKATSAIVLAGKGDDRIYASTGNNTYIYRTGDGADTIVDGGGTDTLNFSDMLLENTSTCQNILIANNNLHVDMKEVA